MKRAFWALLCFSLVACGTEELPAPSFDAGADAGTPLEDAGQVLDAGETAADAGEDPCLGQHARSLVSLSLSPATMQVTVGAKARFVVTGTFDDGCVANVSGSLFYTVANPATARVAEVPPDEDSPLPGRAVEGLAEGNTTVVASTQANGAGMTSNALAVEVTPGAVQPGSTETRGIWVTRFAFSSAAQVRAIVNKAADNNFNAVFFQVRGNGDAYYRSSIVPWWKSGTGTLGGDPGWDPLQVAIETAHARGIQLHAYINAMTGWPDANPIPDSASGAPQHILKQHPEWTCKNGSGGVGDEYVWIGAEPGYIEHFGDVVEEILTRYDVDGIHLDRIRTPGSDFCHTAGLDAAFAQAGGTWAAFQRAQIDKVVDEAYHRIVATKPEVIFSAAVWGIYKRLPGCSTSEGLTGYHQDSLGWMQKGIIDMLNPMIYWDLKPGSCTDWGALVDSFVAGANGRQIVAGMHARDKLADGSSGPNFARIAARIEYARTKQIAGNVVFASTYLESDGTWDDFLAGPYAQPDEPTPMTHR